MHAHLCQRAPTRVRFVYGSTRNDHQQDVYTLSEKARTPLPTCTQTCAYLNRPTRNNHQQFVYTMSENARIHPCQRVPKRVRILTDPQGMTTNNLCTHCLRMHAHPCQRAPTRVRFVYGSTRNDHQQDVYTLSEKARTPLPTCTQTCAYLNRPTRNNHQQFVYTMSENACIHPCQRVPKRVRILTDPQGMTTNNLCTHCLRKHAHPCQRAPTRVRFVYGSTRNDQ